MGNEQKAAAELVELYNEMLDSPLDAMQTQMVVSYVLREAEEDSLQGLPRVKNPEASPSNYQMEKALENVRKDNRLPQTALSLKLLYLVGATEACMDGLHDMLKWDDDEVDGGYYFSPEVMGGRIEMEYRLHRMNNVYDDRAIAHMTRYVEALEKKYPDLMVDLTRTGTPATKLRACCRLYHTDPQTYGAIIDEALKSHQEWNRRVLLTACAFTNFTHSGLCQAFRERWREDLRWTIHTCDAMKYYCPQFLEEEIYSKIYSFDDHVLGECLFFARLGETVGMEEDEVLLGLFKKYDSLNNVDHLSQFLRRYPREQVMRLFYNTTPSTGEGSYWRGDFVLRLWREIFLVLKWDTTPIADVFAERCDEILADMVDYAYSTESYRIKDKYPEELKERTKQDLIQFFSGQDDNALERIIGDKTTRNCIREHTGRYYYGAQQLMGHYCNDPRLARPMKLVTAYSTWCRLRYSNIRFINAVRANGWSLDQAMDYILDWPQPPSRVLEVYDEFLLTDKERGEKDVHYFTPAFVQSLVPRAKTYVLAHEAETLEYINTNTLKTSDFGILRAYYEDNPNADPTPLLRLLTFKDRQLRPKVLKYVQHYPALRPQLEKMLEEGKKDIRVVAEKALAMLDKLNVFSASGANGQAGADEAFDLEAFSAKNCPDIAKALPFTDPALWPKVRRADSEEIIPAGILRCYVGMYGAAKDVERLYLAEKIRPYLNAEDMKALSALIYGDWLAKGAEAKHKGVMALYGIHGGEDAVKELRSAIQKFIEEWRSAMAGAAVQGMAASLTTMALVTVDNLSRTHRNKLVRRVAGETIEASAAALGLTREQMSDRIVPDMGLDAKGEMLLTTGAGKMPGRTFQVILRPDLSIRLFDENQKQLKTFPSYSYHVDDHDQHKDAQSHFTLLKKELQTLFKNQAKRLDLSLRNAREWTVPEYQGLFIQNPIMQRFASSLIFGVYEQGVLRDTFRYAGDGSYSNIRDAVLSLPQEAVIRLVHPLELTQEQRKRWLSQLDDYELTQPFPQLSRPTFDPADVKTPTYEGFANTWISGSSAGKLFRQGWYMGGAGDGGGYYCVFYDHAPTGISACLTFAEDSALSAGGEPGEIAVLGGDRIL